ncbi:MAG: ABC transporter substrate-binding protein [Deltaproteobacteria bacterium]|nr:ABC transporter substrate-binding protein [Deltaproteobacteria bacterium]
MKKILTWLVIFSLVFGSAASMAAEKQKLVVYTSMKEVLIGKLRDAFTAKNPDLDFDSYSAGAGKLMAKLAAERQSGNIVVDVLWTSEIPDFYQLKAEEMLQKYISPENQFILSPIKDPDGFFTPARMGTLGIAYNTKLIKQAPRTWADLLTPEFKNSVGIANPALSGTAYVSISLMVKNLGWEYFEKLKANGAKMGQGSGQVVDDTAAGDLKACLGVDYIALEKIAKGADLGLVFPPEMLVIPSPVAIIKGTKNLNAAQKFVDFLLSKDGQAIVANTGTLPIRQDVPVPQGTGLVSPDEAVKRAMQIDYPQMIKEKEATIKKFTEILGAGK